MIRKLLVTVFLVVNFFFASTVFSQNGPNCPSGVCIGPGGAFSGNLTVASNVFYSSITINNNQTLIVKSGFTLYVGQVGTLATSQVVDFQNGCTVVIEEGASLVVNGLLNNSNNSKGVTVNGSVAVTGNVTAGNGSIIVGAGTLDTTGTITSSGTGSIFTSTGDCTTGPCSGSTLSCSGATNTISGNQTICSGNIPATLTGSNIDSGAGYQWQQSTTYGANFIDILGATSYNYSPGSLSTTTYYRRKETFSSCTGTSAQVTVVVNSIPTAPIIGTITHPTCAIPTGSVVLSGLPASGTWTLTRNPGAVTTTGTGASITISGLIPETYTYTVSYSSCISNATSVTIKNATNSWNGSAWSNGTSPIGTENIVFEGTGTYSSNSDLIACSCLVKNSASVIINSGHTLTLTNELTVIDLGSIAFLDTASLVQINNVSNSGDIDYKRITNARKTDYTYWSSPVSPQTLGALYPPGSTFYSFEATASGEDWKQETVGTNMEPGKGYIANRGAEVPSGPPPPPGMLNITFVGEPNNGPYEINGIFADKSYLLGNPYPSALDADKFLAANAAVLNGTLYFWTHNTQIGVGVSNPGTGLYAYSADDYATYNATGGVGAAPSDLDPVTGQPYPGSAPSGISGGNSNIPTGKIASGQGFFATSKGTLSGTKIVYDNTMRVGVNGITGDNTQFFKTKNPKEKTADPVQKNRIWLNLANKQGAFKQTLIGYVIDATNDYDDRFDGESFDGNEFVDFYSVNQDKNLVIQGRALPFDENDEVPLGFRTTINGDFTINIDQTDGLLANQTVFIEDKLTNTLFDLKSGNYTFSTSAGTFNDRFVLRYTNNSGSKTLGTANFAGLENKVLVSSNNKQIKINSFAGTIDKVTIYDLVGKQIYQKDTVNSNELAIANLMPSNQVLVVKTSLQNGETFTDKTVH